MAAIIHRTTLEYKGSVNSPDFGPEWIVNPDLTALVNVPKKYWKIIGDDVLEMDQAEKDAVDAAELVILKAKLLEDVDSHAESLITDGPGIEYPPASGKYLSLSINAQIKWTGWNLIADDWVSLGLPYPFTVRTKDELDTVTITDAAEVRTVYGLMAQTVAVILGGVEVAKAGIQSATTAEDAQTAADAFLAT